MSRRKRYTRNLWRAVKSPTPIRTTVEWDRFEHEDEPYGVFCYLRDAGELLDAPGRAEVEGLRDWFEDHLDAPAIAAIERCWFKAEAHDHVEQHDRSGRPPSRRERRHEARPERM